MKKILTIGLMSFIALTACQQELIETDTADGSNEKGIIATIVNDDQPLTRATMVDSPTDAIRLHWTEGDAIGVFDTENQNTRFTAALEDISNDGARAVFKAGDAVPKGEFLSYYPYDSSVTSGGGVLNLKMPDTQQFVQWNLKAEPDPAACMMVGHGYANSVSFKNVFAILKVSYVPREDDVVNSVVFSDLSGRPVCGDFTVSMSADGNPVANFPDTGDGTKITLDCDGGVEVRSTVINTFFLVVPAREYPQGFQLEFKLAEGGTDVRTIGRKAGKTLLRSMVYCIGDVSAITTDDYTVVFGENGGMILDDDQMAMVASIKHLGHFSGELGDFYELMVKPELGLYEGMSIIINRLSEALPYGLAGEVVDINPIGSVQQVRVKKYANAARAFKSLIIGSPKAFQPDGTLDESYMVPLDLPQSFAQYVPAPGMEGFTVEITDDGMVLTEKQSEIRPPISRAHKSGNLSLPRLSINLVSNSTDRFSVGASPAISSGIALVCNDYELNYFGITLTPTLQVDASIQKTLEIASLADKEIIFGTWYFEPIAAGPVVLVPEFRVSGYVSMKGNLKLTSTWSYTLGFNIGGSYHSSDGESGWTVRCTDQSTPIPSALSLLLPEVAAQASLDTQTGVIFDIGLALYGIINFTFYGKYGLELSAGVQGRNLFAQMSPVCEGGAAVGVLTLQPARVALSAVECEPWWLRYQFPMVQMYRDTKDPVDGEIYAYPVNKVTSIPIKAKLHGMLLEENELYWYITKRSKGTSSLVEGERVFSTSAGSFPKSSILYSDDNVKEVVLTRDFSITHFPSDDCIYSVTIYCKARGAVLGQTAPRFEKLGCVEITREKDVNYHLDGKQEVFLIRDDAGGAELDNDRNIVYYSGSRL